MKKKRKSKEGYETKHHLIPKDRVKRVYSKQEIKNDKDRVIMLWQARHLYWHFLFKNLTIHEIIEVLKRVKRIKKFST